MKTLNTITILCLLVVGCCPKTAIPLYAVRLSNGQTLVDVTAGSRFDVDTVTFYSGGKAVYIQREHIISITETRTP